MRPAVSLKQGGRFEANWVKFPVVVQRRGTDSKTLAFTLVALTSAGTATAFPLRLRLHSNAARAPIVICFWGVSMGLFSFYKGRKVGSSAKVEALEGASEATN